MVDRLIHKLVKATLALAIAVSSLPVLAQAGSPPDPTRPANATDVPGAANAATPASTGLQAVILRPNGKSVAVINGQTVAMGGKVGEARLVSLTANEAVLTGPNGKEVLKLEPVAEKKQSVSAHQAGKTKKRITARGASHD